VFSSNTAVFDTGVDAAIISRGVVDDQCTTANAQATSDISIYQFASRDNLNLAVFDQHRSLV